MLTNGFTVFHKDSNLSAKLGRGFVVGELQQKTTIQTQGTVLKDNVEVPAIVTEESVKIHYQVLWDNARTVSPSLHSSTELVWEMITEEFLDLASQADDEDDDDFDDEEDDDTLSLNDDDADVTGNETTV